MFTAQQDLEALLVERQVITLEQLEEARQLQQRCGIRLADALVRLGYAGVAQVLAIHAEALGLAFFDLSNLVVPPAVIELLPESVARENVVLPVARAGQALIVALGDPTDVDVVQKLQFILNRPICPVLAIPEQIVEAINHYYGPSETESVDSMLAEFTDTAIDFTQTDYEFDLALAAAPQAEVTAPPAARTPPLVERRATVRYYSRMNPERTFPLLVVLSRKAIEEVVKRGVAQGQSEAFRVEEGSLVELEPILPGCACYPAKETVRVGASETTTTFWVVPHVLGKVMQARVVVRQGGTVLAEVPLEVRVARQSATLLLGGLSLVLPFVLLVLKHFKLDFESQLEDGFGLYAQLLGWALNVLTPELLGGLLLAGTAALYFWLRPRRRDVFWDVRPVAVEESPAATELAPAPAPTLLDEADRLYRLGDRARALPLYERAFAGGAGGGAHYFRASLAAHLEGDTARALRLLQQAEEKLPPAQMKGPLWYNLGCFAARLGRFAEALRYLHRAVDAGFSDPAKYRSDSDLASLRWHAGFRRLLAGIGG
jgi:hypothetical protein